jgi:hypothetical protein
MQAHIGDIPRPGLKMRLLFDQRPQNSNVIYGICDKPMSA